MSEQKWEDLNVDCLVNILGRLGMESLLLDVPFVCKSWYKAALNPHCWRHLDFSKITLDDLWDRNDFTSRLLIEYRVEENFCVTAFIKSIVKRSDKSATFLALPGCCTEEALLYIADECPNLRTLLLPYDLPCEHILKIPDYICKWKNLEGLRLGSSFQMREVLAHISIHCKNFVGLAITRANIGDDEALAIVTLVPNIKYLYLRSASMEKENLVMILQGCKELVHFDATGCIGFDEEDEDILKLASHITTFELEGSMLSDDDDYDDYCPNYRDDGFHDGNVTD